jgi:hypothetical protein
MIDEKLKNQILSIIFKGDYPIYSTYALKFQTSRSHRVLRIERGYSSMNQSELLTQAYIAIWRMRKFFGQICLIFDGAKGAISQNDLKLVLSLALNCNVFQ